MRIVSRCDIVVDVLDYVRPFVTVFLIMMASAIVRLRLSPPLFRIHHGLVVMMGWFNLASFHIRAKNGVRDIERERQRWRGLWRGRFGHWRR